MVIGHTGHYRPASVPRRQLSSGVSSVRGARGSYRVQWMPPCGCMCTAFLGDYATGITAWEGGQGRFLCLCEAAPAIRAIGLGAAVADTPAGRLEAGRGPWAGRHA